MFGFLQIEWHGFCLFYFRAQKSQEKELLSV